MEEIAGAEEEVIPKRVGKQDRTYQSEGDSPDGRRGQQKKPVKNAKADRVIQSADDHPPPERNAVRWEAKTRQALLDPGPGEETFERHAERAHRERIDNRTRHRSPLLQQQSDHEKQNAGGSIHPFAMTARESAEHQQREML